VIFPRTSANVGTWAIYSITSSGTSARTTCHDGERHASSCSVCSWHTELYSTAVVSNRVQRPSHRRRQRDRPGGLREACLAPFLRFYCGNENLEYRYDLAQMLQGDGRLPSHPGQLGSQANESFVVGHVDECRFCSIAISYEGGLKRTLPTLASP
jgi:hypothetical protein